MRSIRPLESGPVLVSLAVYYPTVHSTVHQYGNHLVLHRPLMRTHRDGDNDVIVTYRWSAC